MAWADTRWSYSLGVGSDFDMTTKICFTHSMPAIVIAHTVEMKSISPDTWTRGPVLSYFPDLVTTFTNDRATLTRRDHQPQGDLRSIGSCAIGHRAANVLFRFVNNHSSPQTWPPAARLPPTGSSSQSCSSWQRKSAQL